MYLNEILPGNWREDKWPEHIEVSHEASRFKSRRYVPRVNSANKSSANPVDGIWCSHCGWAGVIAQDMTDLDEDTEPRFDTLAEDVPCFCPKCGSLAQCDDGQTAITVADALQNFMRTGLIGDDFHTRTRLVGEKEG